MSAAYPRSSSQEPISPKDEQDLNTLVILTKIYAWFCLISVVMCLVGIAALALLAPAIAEEARRPGSSSSPATLGIFFIAMIVGLIFSIGMSWLYFKSASCIKERENKMLIQIASGIACTNAPLGLGLGIYTFIVLERPSIRVLFGR